mgnify:CR=1 FL=1
MAELNPEILNNLVGKMLGDLGGAFSVPTVRLGIRLGRLRLREDRLIGEPDRPCRGLLEIGDRDRRPLDRGVAAGAAAPAPRRRQRCGACGSP